MTASGRVMMQQRSSIPSKLQSSIEAIELFGKKFYLLESILHSPNIAFYTNRLVSKRTFHHAKPHQDNLVRITTRSMPHF